MNMNQLDELLIAYADKFNDSFPIFAVMHLGDDEIIDLIQNAIDKNEPYDPKYQDGVVY